MASEPSSSWQDPFLFDEQLTEEERMIRDTARQFADDKLMPRIVEANRAAVFAPLLMK